MIILKGEDKTGEIVSFKNNVKIKKIEIIFAKSKREYHYEYSDVKKYKKPVTVDLEGKTVYYDDGIPVYQPRKLLYFGNKVRIVKDSGYYETVDSNKIILFESVTKNKNVTQIMDYFRDISQYIPVEEDSEYDVPYLKFAMDQLTFVHPESVLADYLQQKPIKKRRLEKDGIIFPFRFNLSQKKST